MPELTQERVKDYLNSLGTSVFEVHDTLKEKEAKGLKAQSFKCVLAKDLSQEFGVSFCVGLFSATVYDSDSEIILSVKLPQVVRVFTDLFDKGEFPDLEESA